MNTRADLRTAQKLSNLRKSEIFDSFNPMEMAKLLGIVEELELPKHHIIFSPGMPADSVYIIEKGRVRLTRIFHDGRAVILAMLGPGDLVSEAVWEISERDNYAETLEETRLYQISKEAFEGLIRQNPEFGLRLIQLIGFRLKQAHLRIEDLVFRPVQCRVARLIVTLSESHGKVTTQGIKLEFPLTHQEIADMVGSSRVTVTQILNRFRLQKWINIESKRVVIYNLTALESLVASDLEKMMANNNKKTASRIAKAYKAYNKKD